MGQFILADLGSARLGSARPGFVQPSFAWIGWAGVRRAQRVPVRSGLSRTCTGKLKIYPLAFGLATTVLAMAHTDILWLRRIPKLIETAYESCLQPKPNDAKPNSI